MPQHQPTPARKARNIVRKGDGKYTEWLREQERRSSKPVAGPSEPDRHSREDLKARNGTGSDRVLAVAIGRAGDRDMIVSGYDYGTVRRWDAATGDPIGTPLAGHTNQVQAVAISRVRIRDVIVSGSADGTVRRWDAATGDPIGTPLVGHQGLSVTGDRETFGPVGMVSSVATGRIGDRDVIAAGCNDGEVHIWKAATRGLVGRLRAIPHGVHLGSPVWAVAIYRAGDRDLIAAGSADGLWIWDVTGDSVRTLRAGDFGPCVWSLAAGRVGDRHVFVSGSSKGVPGSSEGKVEIWDAVTGDPIETPLTDHRGGVKAVAIGRAGDRDVIVSAFDDGTVQIRDAVTGDPAGVPVDHDSGIQAVTIGPAGERDLIVFGHWDGTVTVREHHRSHQQP